MTSETSRGSAPSIPHAIGAPVTLLGGRLVRFVEAALKVAAERRQLASLDDRLLKDIGLSRSQIERETTRDFLDVPEHRIGQ